MSQPEPLTEQQLDEIAGRAAHLHEYACQHDGEGDTLAGEDVPALLADLRRARDRVAELEAYAYGCDAEGCVLPHSSWCDAAKKTAAANDGCTCGKPWTGHPQPHAMHCWTVNPPRAEVEEMRKRIAELSATVTPDATPAPTSAPLAASHGPAGDREGETGTEGAAGREADPLPDEEFTGTQPCGHDDYHDPHPWADRPDLWCPGIGYDDDQATTEEATR